MSGSFQTPRSQAANFEPPPLSSREPVRVHSADFGEELSIIQSDRSRRGLPSYEMHTSLVTKLPVSAADDERRGRLARKIRPSKPAPPLGLVELRHGIAESRQHLFSTRITHENVAVTGGARHAIFGAVIATVDASQEVITMPPCFNRYPGLVLSAGAHLRSVPLMREHNYQPDIGELSRAWSGRTKAILATSPNNPTGTVLDPESLRRLQMLAAQRRGFLMLDETFEAFNFSRAAAAPIDLNLDNTIVIGSFSETYSIPDLRAGYLIASKRVIQRVSQIERCCPLSTPLWVQQLGLELLHNREAHLARVIPMIKERHLQLTQALLENPSIGGVHGDSGTYLWLKPKFGCVDCRETALHIARETGIMIMPGIEFAEPGAFRIGLGQITSRQKFTEICRFLKAFQSWVPAASPTRDGEFVRPAWIDHITQPPLDVWSDPAVQRPAHT